MGIDKSLVNTDGYEGSINHICVAFECGPSVIVFAAVFLKDQVLLVEFREAVPNQEGCLVFEDSDFDVCVSQDVKDFDDQHNRAS